METQLNQLNVVAGFADRLLFLVQLAGHRKHGSVNVVVKYSTLSRSGVTKMLENDRPPRAEYLESLTGNIAGDFKRHKGLAVKKSELSDYLLYSTALPEPLAQIIPDYVPDTDHNFVNNFVLTVAGRKDINLSSVSAVNRRKVVARIAHYCSKNNVSELTPKLETIIESLLHLALEDELL
jgi:hypothetical protein